MPEISNVEPGEHVAAPTAVPLDVAASQPRTTLAQRAVGLLVHPKTPLCVFVALGIALAGVVGQRLLPRLSGTPNIVVFDPVLFVNSQRAAASILATQPNADLALTMTQVAKKAEAIILEEAGGATVLVKQAVVVPDGLRDITEDVLKRFGLPTKVPTVTNSASTLSLDNLAPTDSSFSGGALREDYRMELQTRARDVAIDQEKKDSQQSLLP